MATAILPHSANSKPEGQGSVRFFVASALAVWLLLVLSCGAAGAFVGPPGTPPLALALGVGAPLAVFFVALRLWPAFREFVLSVDLRVIAAMQAWRWAGFGFLALYAHQVLPAVFALPAGLGDMAVGFTAPWIVLSLIRDRGFATRGAFIRWNVLGILDLIVAVSIGTVSAIVSTGAPGEVSTAPMATLPLLLIPAFLVPLFLMLHATALMQSRLLSRSPVGA